MHAARPSPSHGGHLDWLTVSGELKYATTSFLSFNKAKSVAPTPDLDQSKVMASLSDFLGRYKGSIFFRAILEFSKD